MAWTESVVGKLAGDSFRNFAKRWPGTPLSRSTPAGEGQRF